MERAKNYEGYVAQMYCDVKGYVTVGYGHLLKDAEAAAALDFVHKGDNQAASADEKKADWQAVKKKFDDWLKVPENANKPENQRPGWMYYKDAAKLEMPKEVVGALLRKDMEASAATLKATFPEYDSFPDEAKEGLLDMVFSLGIGTLTQKFRKFTQAVKDKDWSKAAAECHRLGIDEPRNKEVKALFEKAGQR
jgi:GH24 family phage-related lysozyme (muramidase)